MPWAAGTGGRHSKYLLNKWKGKCLPCKLPGNISEVDKRPLIHILPQINHFSSQKTKKTIYLTFSLPSHIILFLMFSCSVMSNSLWPRELQHTRLPCLSLSPWVCSDSRALSVMPSNHLILCRPLLLLPSILASIRVFSNVLVKYNASLICNFKFSSCYTS